jgi:putative peptidoglycan lipid II flippase
LKHGSAKRGIDPSAHGARSHVRTGIVLSVIQVFGLLLSVGQDAISAKLFGARVEMDVYLEAWIVPVVLANTVGPALQNTLVPHFALARAQRGDEAAWELATEALLVGLGVFALLGLVGIGASRFVLGFVAAGSPAELKPLLQDIYFIGFAFGGLSLASSLLSGLCAAVGRFIVPALLANLSALSPIVGLLVFGRSMGVRALPVSLLAGAVGQTIVLLWLMHRLGLRLARPRPGMVMRVGALIKDATTVALATVPIALIAVAERHFGSQLAEGAVAQLTYATKLVSAGFRVFASALGIMGLPLLSAYLARGERERFQRVFSFLFRLGCYVSVIGVIGLVLASQPLVQLLFQRGRFTQSDTAMVATCVRAAAACLFYGVVFPILNAALLSGRRVWILPIVNFFGLGIYLFTALQTFRVGGSPLGLAIAYGLGYNAILIPSYLLLWRERVVTFRPVLQAAARSMVIAPLVFIPTWLSLRGLTSLSISGLPMLLLVGLVGGTVGLLAISVIDGEVREHVLEALHKRPPATPLEPRMGDA